MLDIKKLDENISIEKMENYLHSKKELKLETTNQKSNLYVVNSTIRETSRIAEILKIYKLLNIKENTSKDLEKEELINIFNNSGFFNIDEEELTYPSIGKRLSEINILGLFHSKLKKGYVNIYSEYPDSFFNNNDNDLEYNSTILLYILKGRGTLDLVSNLIMLVGKKWNEFGRKRKGISKNELLLLQWIQPYLEKENINDIHSLSDFIIKIRMEYSEQLKKKSKGYIRNYVDYIKIFGDSIIDKESKIIFKKYNTIADYNDTLCRTLHGSNCFSNISAGRDTNIYFNVFFISKLDFFLQHSFIEIKELFINSNFIKTLDIYEKAFFKEKFNAVVNDPISIRFDKLNSSKKNCYLLYDKKKQEEELKVFVNNKPKEWYNFEHACNFFTTYHIKYIYKDPVSTKPLTEEDLSFAIKFDDKGNNNRTTTSGIADIFIIRGALNVICESSLRKGYNLRVNEFVQTTTHAEKIYDNNPKPTLCFPISFNKEKKFIEDFKNQNISQQKVKTKYSDIIYIPLSYEEYISLLTKKGDILLELYAAAKKYFTEIIDFNEKFVFKGIEIF